MYYRHNLDYTYPERSDQHMLVLKRTRVGLNLRAVGENPAAADAVPEATVSL